MPVPIGFSSRFSEFPDIIFGLPAGCAALLRAALWALLSALALAGCSAVQMGYNNAPELSYWWLDSYFDFNDSQSLQVRADLAALQAWHRQSELARYIHTLQTAERLASSAVTATQVCDLYAELQPRLQAVLDQAEPGIAVLASRLTPEQLVHLQRQLDKRSRKWREKWLDGSPAERNARRVDQWVERAEMLYGPLAEPQLAILRAQVAVSKVDPTISYRESLRRHQDALQTLRQLRSGSWSEPQARAVVHAWLARAIRSPDAVHRENQEQATQEVCRTQAALHNSTTPAQRLQAIATLKDYETAARALQAAGP